MLFGDPNTFAIWCDSVESWSSGTFKNGCFAYFLKGSLLYSTKSTIGTDLVALRRLPCMSIPPVDEHLFHLPSKEGYEEIYKKAFPEENSQVKDSDYKHLASPVSLSDDGYNIFLIEWGQQGKLVYGEDGEKNWLGEVVMKIGEFQGVVNEAYKNFFDNAESIRMQ